MEKEKVDKKDHILDVAERVFSELGFDGASTRTISGEAGVNMAMLNYYFGSKEGLFLAVFERKIASFRHVLQNIGSSENTSVLDKLDQFIDNYVNKMVVNSCFQKLINMEISSGKQTQITEKITEMMMHNVVAFKKIFEEGIMQGIFRPDIDIEMIIITIVATKNHIVNASHITSSMLGHDVKDEVFLEGELKPRIKAYMKTLLKAYIVK